VATRRHFTQEYKDQAVSLVLDSGRSIAEVARSIGVHEMTLGKWVKNARDSGRTSGKDLSENERVELERLRRENAILRMERDFAKKVAAGSTGQRNSDCQLISRSEIAERLAGSGVELQRDRVELGLCVAGQVGPFREILA
jgi:transposase